MCSGEKLELDAIEESKLDCIIDSQTGIEIV